MPENEAPEGTKEEAAPGTEAIQTADQSPADPAAEIAKWKAMSRKHEAQAKENATAARRLAEIEEANKTEAQKLADARDAAAKEAATATGEALRLRVALRKGLTETQAKRLIGSTEEDLSADADELLSSFRQEPAGEKETPEQPTRPKEKLKSGATGAVSGEVTQLQGDDLRGMSSAEIVKAKAEGRLNTLLGITT